MEEKIIYVAGNPHLYPLEYYDSNADTFMGVIPELLQSFSQETSYDIRYYDTGNEDQREELAENLQVDLVSGYAVTEETEEGITIFEAEQAGHTVYYQIYFTDVAPQEFQEELEDYFSALSQPMKTAYLLEAANEQNTVYDLRLVAAGVILFFIFLIVLFIWRIFYYRRRLKKVEEKLEVDEITGLGNIDYLTRYYKQFINDKNKVLYSVLYFYVDTERLRRLSDSKQTNEFLRYLAAILQEYQADTDILAKISEDGFVMLKLLGEMQNPAGWLQPIVDRVHAYSDMFQKPYETDVSIGIYQVKASDWDLDEMLLRAEQSAYTAYREKVSFKVCSDALLTKMAEEKALQEDMNRALMNKEFQIYLQFYVEPDSGEIMGAEALSRWSHPARGFLTPEKYIPFMEQEGIVSKLDYDSLEQVCFFLEELHLLHINDFFVSCNFSRETLAASDFVERFCSIVQKYQFDKRVLILEVTESSNPAELSQMYENINTVRDYGVRIALDDFGEGFTSFYDLLQSSIDGLKLDKSLVRNAQSKKGKAILKAMIQVGHELGLTILAEGVEAQEQMEILKNLGCDVIQGYQYYYPIPLYDAKKQIMEQRKK